VKVRLAEIDTPESRQPYGTRAKQALSDLAYGKEARVVVQDTDKYGRTVGRVYVGDVNAVWRGNIGHFEPNCLMLKWRPQEQRGFAVRLDGQHWTKRCASAGGALSLQRPVKRPPRHVERLQYRVVVFPNHERRKSHPCIPAPSCPSPSRGRQVPPCTCPQF
jgi:hypothetical protein